MTIIVINISVHPTLLYPHFLHDNPLNHGRLGGTWHPKGWNGIEGCRFIPEPCFGAVSSRAIMGGMDSAWGERTKLWV